MNDEDTVAQFFFWKSEPDRLPRDFYELERQCFGTRYAITPKTRAAFDAMFQTKALVGECRHKGTLVAMLFLDELLEHRAYYLRVICVTKAFCKRGLATRLLKGAIEYFDTGPVYFGFVSETPEVVRCAIRIGAIACETVPDDVSDALSSYKKVLCGKQPGTILEGYYKLTSGGEASGLYSVFRM